MYNADTCYSCSTGRLNPPICPCNLGYYENLNGSCTLCDRKCTSCKFESDNCLKCAGTKENPPLCTCSDISYEDP